MPLLNISLLGEPILCNIHLPSYKDLNDPHNLLRKGGDLLQWAGAKN